MVCNYEEFLVASKLQMIKLKYRRDVPGELVEFMKNPEKFSEIGFPENKKLSQWKRFNGSEKKTIHGKPIEATMADGTLKVFQTFYICNSCAKVYWDGGHYHNNQGGKLDGMFDLYPEAENLNKEN